MTYYAGLDLSMETTQICIVDETDKKVESSPEMTHMHCAKSAASNELS